MNKIFYFFIVSFFIAFSGVFALMNPQWSSHRTPAAANSWDSTTGNTIIIQQNPYVQPQQVIPVTDKPVFNMGNLNVIYADAITKETKLSSDADTVNKALQLSMTNYYTQSRNNRMLGMYPDTESYRLDSEKNRIYAERSSNLYTAIMNMALVFSSMQSGLPVAAQQEFYAKYSKLVSLYSSLSTGSLYIYPPPSTAVLAGATSSSALGITSPLVDIPAGAVSPLSQGVNADIPVGGVIQPSPSAATDVNLNNSDLVEPYSQYMPSVQ